MNDPAAVNSDCCRLNQCVLHSFSTELFKQVSAAGVAFGCGRGKVHKPLMEAPKVALASEMLLLQAGKSYFTTRFSRSASFACQEFAVLTASRLAWPDGLVDRQQPELHETTDAMPAHVGVENQLAEDLHRAMGMLIEEHLLWDRYRLVQAAIAGVLFHQGCKDPWLVRHYCGGLFCREGSCTL